MQMQPTSVGDVHVAAASGIARLVRLMAPKTTSARRIALMVDGGSRSRCFSLAPPQPRGPALVRLPERRRSFGPTDASPEGSRGARLPHGTSPPHPRFPQLLALLGLPLLEPPVHPVGRLRDAVPPPRCD